MLRSNIATPCVILRGVLVEVVKPVSGIAEQPLISGSRPRLGTVACSIIVGGLALPASSLVIATIIIAIFKLM